MPENELPILPQSHLDENLIREEVIAQLDNEIKEENSKKNHLKAWIINPITLSLLVVLIVVIIEILPSSQNSKQGPSQIVLKLETANNQIMSKYLIRQNNQEISFGYADHMTYYERGMAYADIGELQHALNDLTYSIHLKPRNPKAYYNRAAIYKMFGADDQALRDYNKAVELGYRRGMPYSRF